MRSPLLALLLFSTACATARKDAATAPAAAAPSTPRPLLRPPPLASVVLREAEKPLVTFRLVFRAGSADDPAGKEGLTALTATLLAEGGTQALTSAELLRALYPMAAELSVDTTQELTTFHGRVHRDHLPRFFQIFTDVVVAPRLDPKELERLRQDAISALENGLRGMSDEALGKSALQSLLYARHPYRHPEVGTVQGLRAITLDDVKAHWKRVFTQDRVVLGLAGAVDAELEASLKARLAALPARGAEPVAIPAPPDSAGHALILQKETLSTAISFGHTYGLRRGDPDYFAVAFALSYLGEHRMLNGVLFRELRERRGLNYGDYVYVEHFEQEPGTTYPKPNVARALHELSVWIRPVEPKHAVFAVRGALFFLQRLIDAPIPVAEFQRARGFLTGYTRLWEQTDARRLGYALDGLYDGVPSFLDAYRAALADLTPEGVQAAVKRHVQPQRLAFAFVTQDAQGLAAALRSQAPSPIVYASAKPDALLQQDAQIAQVPLPLSPQEIRVEPAGEFMER